MDDRNLITVSYELSDRFAACMKQLLVLKGCTA
jgi:hypothetical protein